MGIIINIFKLPELRKRVLFTLMMLAVYRLGVFIAVPGVDRKVMAEIVNQGDGGFLGYFNMFSGGALEQLSVFALGIMPYISASIIMQLMTVVIPRLEQLSKEGETGRRKINQYSRYGTVGLAMVQGYFMASWLESQNTTGQMLVLDPGLPFQLETVLTLTGGTLFLMWLGEQITERGVSNGTSLIIFGGIVTAIPGHITGYLQQHQSNMQPLTIALFLALLPQFVDPQRGGMAFQLASLGILFVLAALLTFGLLTVLAGQAGRWLRRSLTAQRRLNQGAALVFAALAARLAAADSLAPLQLSAPEAYYDLQQRPLGQGDRRIGLLVQLHDVTAREHERRQVQQHLAARDAEHSALREQALRDPLTGLWNRRALEERFAVERAYHASSGQPLALVLLDLDHFKRINDRYGHAVGDAVLREVGAALRNALRSADAVFRIGGEEFALLLAGADALQALRRTAGLREHVAQGRYGGLDEPVTFSAGVVATPDHGVRLDALLAAADGALYQAKAQGRNRSQLAPAPPPPA